MPDGTESRKTTYLFFEPKNDAFFSSIATHYSNWYFGTLRDASVSLKDSFFDLPQEKREGLLKNYRTALPFQGCNSLTNGCTTQSRKCGTDDKYVVVTMRQKELLKESVDDVTRRLEESGDIHNNIILNKIKHYCPWTMTLQTFSASQAEDNFLERYAEHINTRAFNDKSTEKLVFARAQEHSDYPFISGKVTVMPLEACDEYRNM